VQRLACRPRSVTVTSNLHLMHLVRLDSLHPNRVGVVDDLLQPLQSR
jgi:hypothetical protein